MEDTAEPEPLSRPVPREGGKVKRPNGVPRVRARKLGNRSDKALPELRRPKVERRPDRRDRNTDPDS